MPPANLPTVSVVIPTHGRRDRLPQLLGALASEDALEIVVVVNGGDDGSLALLEARSHSDDRLRPLFVEEAGQSRAQHVGANAAEGEVLLMLDDDVLAAPGLVAGHARHHAAAIDLVVVGYMPVVRPPRRQPGEYPLDLYSRAYELACEEYEADPGAILGGLWAGNVSIRRDNALRVGLEAGEGIPDGYSYHEDRDLGLRCRQSGLRGRFDRRLRACHAYERTPAQFLQAARISGRTRAAIHVRHGEQLGPLPEDFYERVVPLPGRLLVRWARRAGLRAPIQAMLKGGTVLAGRLRLFRLESHLGYLLGTIEQQHAALAAKAARGRGVVQ